MSKYTEIHLINFPKNTTIMLENKFRQQFIKNFIDSCNTWKKAVEYLNNKSGFYNVKTKIGVGSLSHWFYGIEKTSKKTRRMSLWAIIEIAKKNNINLKKIEQNVLDICSIGRGTSVKAKFPLYLTPELVSIAFHLFGDGYLAKKGQQSHYRQVNQEGLNNFKQKLLNCFGKFNIVISEKSKIAIPKVLSEFLKEYLNLGSCYWNKSRINKTIKKLPKEFLLAGLNAFIVDEGHIGESIEIYSGNKLLLQDIKEIAEKLGYNTSKIDIKIYKKSKTYRTRISTKNAQLLLQDIQLLSKKFPTCGLAHKEHLLEEIVRRQTRDWKTRPTGETKERIITLLTKGNINSKELRLKLNISGSTLREHLITLEAQNKVKRIRQPNSCCLLWSKIK